MYYSLALGRYITQLIYNIYWAFSISQTLVLALAYLTYFTFIMADEVDITIIPTLQEVKQRQR